MSSGKWRPFCLGLDVLKVNAVPITHYVWRENGMTLKKYIAISQDLAGHTKQGSLKS